MFSFSVFVYLGISCFLSHFWKVVLLDLEFLMDSLSLSTLNTSSHCLLVSMASNEKSVFNLIESLLSIRHDEPLLSCCSRDYFFLLSFDYDLSVLLDYDLIIICVHFLNSSYLELFFCCCFQLVGWLVFFIEFGKFPATISSFFFLILSLLFFWYSHYAYFAILIVPLSSLILCSFFFFFFSFPQTG